MRIAVLCLVAALAAAACSGEPAAPPVRDGSSVQEGTSTVESGAPCVPAPETTAALPATYPPRLPLPPGSLLTAVERLGGVDLVSGRVDAGAEAVLDHFRTAAEPAGFAVVRDEDEGRAGKLQLFGSTATLDVTVAQLTCPRGASSFTVQVQVP